MPQRFKRYFYSHSRQFNQYQPPAEDFDACQFPLGGFRLHPHYPGSYVLPYGCVHHVGL